MSREPKPQRDRLTSVNVNRSPCERKPFTIGKLAKDVSEIANTKCRWNVAGTVWGNDWTSKYSSMTNWRRVQQSQYLVCIMYIIYKVGKHRSLVQKCQGMVHIIDRTTGFHWHIRMHIMTYPVVKCIKKNFSFPKRDWSESL